MTVLCKGHEQVVQSNGKAWLEFKVSNGNSRGKLRDFLLKQILILYYMLQNIYPRSVIDRFWKRIS